MVEESSCSAARSRRRLESINRHILPRPPANEAHHHHHPLHPSPLGAHVEPNSGDAAASAPVVIGGMVLDIHAKPSAHPNPGTTTPGKVQYASGGVARNIVECMSKLGTGPFMISMVGNDMAGDLLLKYWRLAGLVTKGIMQVHDIATPVVSNIFDCNGELIAAVASVEAVEKFLTPGWIHQFRHQISVSPILLVDANLSPQSLKAACQIADESGIPVWFEPVSVIKSARIAPIANYITCTSPNEHELVAMANALSPPQQYEFVEVENSKEKGQAAEYLFKMLRPVMFFLLEKGIKLLLVSLGSNGVFLCCKEQLSLIKDYRKCKVTAFSKQLHEKLRENDMLKLQANSSEGHSSRSCVFHFPALPASVVSLTGAGDCLVGGILAALSSGLELMQSVAVGIAVAKAAVESESNVPSSFSATTIADEARRTLSSGKCLWFG